jgi:AcrR family transcriptional regulator
MNKENKKYRAILDAARDLYWKHGFRRVSVDEICKKANVSKMTFYKYFPDKVELAKSIFNNVVEEGEEKVRQIMNEESLASEKINKLMLMKLEGSKNISQEFLYDFYMGPGELKDYVKDRTRKAWDILIDDFRKAQDNGVFRKDFKPELLMKIQGKISELLEDETVTSMYESKQELIMQFAKIIFYGISPQE